MPLSQAEYMIQYLSIILWEVSPLVHTTHPGLALRTDCPGINIGLRAYSTGLHGNRN